jgi:hypothetical protein
MDRKRIIPSSADIVKEAEGKLIPKQILMKYIQKLLN